jgi:hypothetical protein
MREVQEALHSWLPIAGFVAAIISFWRHPRSITIVSSLLALVAAIASFLAGWGTLIIARVALGSDHTLLVARPSLMLAGMALLCVYFAVSLFTIVPLFSPRRLVLPGVLLHLVVLPLAIALIDRGQENYDFRGWLRIFGFHLCMGLAFGLVCFRLYELRQTIDRNV